MRLIQRHRSLGAMLGAMLLASPGLAETAPTPAITVSGEATVSVAPDLAQIDAGITSEAKTAETSEANNAAMGNIMLALKSAGVAESDYQTSDFAAISAAAIRAQPLRTLSWCAFATSTSSPG